MKEFVVKVETEKQFHDVQDYCMEHGYYNGKIGFDDWKAKEFRRDGNQCEFIFFSTVRNCGYHNSNYPLWSLEPITYKQFKNMKNTNQTVPYEGMKEIHDIACSGWKKKIAEWTKVFEDTQLSKEQVNEMFRAANVEQKKVLNKWLKESQPDIETLKQELKELVLPYPNAKTKQEKSINALVKAFKIAETFNEGVELKWEDTNTYKYYPYKYFVGGCRFRVGYCCDSCYFPAGLCFVSESLCQKAIDNFPEVYNDYWMLDK